MVAVYSANAQVYFERKYGPASPTIYHIQSPVDLRFHGFAAIGSKKAFAHFSKLDNGGLYYLSLDETSRTGARIPVDGAVGARSSGGVITNLWGSDGESLI